LFKNQPFNHVVRQHGTFYPNILTFGTTRTFPEKEPEGKFEAKFGIWKNADPAHTGFNKTLGGHHGRSTEYDYVEQQEQDHVVFQKDVKNLVWHPTHQMSKTMASMTSTLRN
jgi:hypothetical protein